MTDRIFEVQVVGEVGENVVARIQAEVGTVVTVTEPVTTVIRGRVADQSGLVGMLDLMHALGLQVCAVRRVTDLTGEIEAHLSVAPGSEQRPR